MGSRSRNDAMDQYFNEFVPMLEEAIRDEVEDEDPTIDLDCMQVARPVPHKTKPRTSTANPPNRTFEMTVRDGSCSLDGLRDITEHLKRGSMYGDKLIRIMLDGLEKSISPEFFRVIIDRGVPPTWLPIVKRNNEDTPYIEFLIKNDKSDEEPFSQIADYSLEHLALSKYVLDHMLKGARGSDQQNRPPPEAWRPTINRTKAITHATTSKPKVQQHQLNQQQQQQQQRQQQQQQHQHQPQQQQQNQPKKPQQQPQQQQQPKKRPVNVDRGQRSSLPAMTTSTPIRERQAAANKRASAIPATRPPPENLNDSKRVLPHRACKLPSEGSFCKYLA